MTIEILGLGESLSEYKPNGNITIGVNDIHSRIKTDFVVCVDRFDAFSRERLEVIKNTKCKGFYSQLDCWKNVKNFNKIEVGRVASLDEQKIRCSNNSPFVACVLAYKMGATKIILWGVDMNTHHAFVSNSLQRALSDYSQLREDLNKKGVEIFVGSEQSQLTNVLKLL